MELKEFNNIANAKISSLLNLLKKHPKYYDEMNRPHIYIDNIDYLVSSNEFKEELVSICYENDLNVGIGLINKVIAILSNKIIKNEDKLGLDFRIAKDINNDFLYQLNKNEMVVINDYGYNIMPIDRPIFKDNNTFEDQITPTKKGSMENVLNLFNVDDDDKFLLQVYITSLFVPNISKPSLIITAEKGTGKSTITRNIKRIVDPSPTETSKVPKSISELEKRLSRSYLVCFDNIDNLTPEQSNTFCRAVTGDTYEQNTNDKSYIAPYIRPIILNGIKCPAFKEDLLDRCIILEPKRIKEENIMLEEEINSTLDNQIPFVLSSIFSTISKARMLKKNIRLDKKYRMADWYEWAYCIAESIEQNGGQKFKRLFKENRDKQNDTIIDNNYVALAMRDYAWSGGLGIGTSKEMTSTELYNILKQVAYDNDYAKCFPKNPVWLTRQLKEIIGILAKEGIIVEPFRRINANCFKLTRIVKE